MKTISTTLTTDIEKTLTTLALAITIRRRDGREYRLTNHDETVVIAGETYRHDIAFNLPSIDSSAQLAVDNTQLVLYLDGETFIKADFEAHLYDNAECEIALYDYENLTHGVMSLRKGWFGESVRNENNVVKITVTGLLKILDFEIGRTYQPACDATFGDKRCRVAVNPSQIYSLYNPYRPGDWVYRYDPTLMTSIPLVNASFDADGTRSVAQAITGWTRGEGAQLSVGASAPDGSLAADSTYALYGNLDASSPVGFEHTLYQEITTATIGMANGDIDGGKLSISLFALCGQPDNLLDPVRVTVQALDADGAILDTMDTRYVFLDTADTWRERALAGPVIEGTRSFRVTLYMRREASGRVHGAFDSLRAYYWDHTLGTPYSDVVYKMRRVIDGDGPPIYRFPNSSFEQTVTSPQLDGSLWRTVTSGEGLSAQDGTKFLLGGNDGSGIQRTDNLSPIGTGFDLNRLAWQPRLNLDYVDQGAYYARVDVDIGFGDTSCTATFTVEQKDATFTPVTSHDVVLNYNPGSTGWEHHSLTFPIDPDTRKISIELSATSASGTGNNRVGFDGIEFHFYNTAVVLSTDAPFGYGDADTVWDDTVGALVIDGDLVWQAVAAFSKIDTVASVTDRRTFTGTTIVGAAGSFEGGFIRWISGQNANQINLIRQWTTGTKTVKTYFRAPYPIQVGDRFVYVRSCQKRFLEDCKGVFGNQLNFRGFPYVPGKLTVNPVGADDVV